MSYSGHAIVGILLIESHVLAGGSRIQKRDELLSVALKASPGLV